MKGVKLRVVQANVAIDAFRADRKAELLEHYLRLSDRSTSPQSTGVSDVTHVFWPESAFPFILAHDPAALALIGSRMQNAVLFTGAARVEGDGNSAKYFNSLTVIQHGEIKAYADKMHLTPFGEYMPFATLLARAGVTQFVDIPGGFDFGVDSHPLSRRACRRHSLVDLLRGDFPGRSRQAGFSLDRARV